jgi:gamma-glutamylcyclotransferase (GGCT)/AIG2-like uncharacterized protein YtfP
VIIDGCARFFFYGTLIAGGPPCVGEALVRLRDLGPARIAGLLYAIPDPQGWYPGLVEGAGQVEGRLFEALPEFAEADLAALDAYEDFDPCDPAGSLYRRITVDVAGRPAKVYRFNQPLPAGARPIPDGDFAEWIALAELPAFRC